jgi:hypothetical protein
MENKFVGRAFRAYFLEQGRIGYTGEIPSASLSDAWRLRGKYYVVLRDVVGNVLAVYRARKNAALKRLKRWPAELGEAAK